MTFSGFLSLFAPSIPNIIEQRRQVASCKLAQNRFPVTGAEFAADHPNLPASKALGTAYHMRTWRIPQPNTQKTSQSANWFAGIDSKRIIFATCGTQSATTRGQIADFRLTTDD